MTRLDGERRARATSILSAVSLVRYLRLATILLSRARGGTRSTKAKGWYV